MSAVITSNISYNVISSVKEVP